MAARVTNVPYPLEGITTDEKQPRLPLITFLPRMEEFYVASSLWSVASLAANFDWANASAQQITKNATAVSYMRSALSPPLASNIEHIPHINVIWNRLVQVQLGVCCVE